MVLRHTVSQCENMCISQETKLHYVRNSNVTLG